jgi:Arc/MetJ family transcription regulator
MSRTHLTCPGVDGLGAENAPLGSWAPRLAWATDSARFWLPIHILKTRTSVRRWRTPRGASKKSSAPAGRMKFLIGMNLSPLWISFPAENGWRKPVPGRVGRSASECVYLVIAVHIMRTNIVIDDKLMRDTLRATGLKTKREVVEEGLRSLLRLKRQAGIRRLRGKLNWQGDLDAMRRDS